MTSHAVALSFSYIFTGATLLTLSLLVFFKRNKSPLHYSFALYSLAIAWWCLNDAIVINLDSKPIAQIFNILCVTGISFIPALLLHVVYSLCPKYKQNTFLYLSYSISVMLIFLLHNNLFIQDLLPLDDLKYFPIPAIGYSLFLIYFFITATYALGIIYIEQKKSSDVFYKKQLQLFLTSTLLAYFGGSFQFLMVYRIYFSHILAPIGVVMVGLCGIIIFYAIIKHKLLDIDIVIRRSLIYSIFIAVISLLYLILIFVLEKTVQQFFGYQSQHISLAVAFGLGIFIVPIRNMVQGWVDKLLFKGTSVEIAEENEKLRAEKQRHQSVAALAGGVAHEIRNPLTAIKAFCEHAKTKKDDPEFIDRFERVTFNEIDRIEQLTQQLLDFAKPSKPNFQTVDINDVIHDTLLLTQNSLKKSNIELVQSLDKDLPAIQADPNQLKQALLNLILNAVDAMDNGGTITITTTNENNRTLITITDTGCGIPSDKLDQIFHPFHSNKSHGTGLGLSIVKTIVENHHGRITVNNKPDQGTTFKVVI